jgi:bifunctional DNase/RNase
MRAEAPIFVTANVLMNGSVSTDSAKDAEEAQEFKDFIQNIKPSDFEKLMNGKHEETDQ